MCGSYLFFPQVRLSQLAVDGGGKHGPLVHLPAPLRAPGLAVRGRDMDASGDQLRPRETDEQRDGRQGTRELSLWGESYSLNMKACCQIYKRFICYTLGLLHIKHAVYLFPKLCV